MNYSYVYVNRLLGIERSDLFSQLKHSIDSLKKKELKHGSIHVFSDKDDFEIINFCREQGCFNNPISLSRQYSKDNISLIDILTEKIIQLKNFDNNQEVCLLDIDTEFIKAFPEDFWKKDQAVLWKPEYYITQFRNLDKVLPTLPWNELDIDFNESFIMYNTGVVYIPKQHRKEICEKALLIADYLNSGIYPPDQRYGNKLDEQIALSIVLHDVYGKNDNIRHCEDFVYHFWEEKTKGLKWWK